MDNSSLFTFTLVLTCLGAVIRCDHCPQGNWHIVNGTCMLFSTQALKWREAITDCYMQDATLLLFLATSDRLAFVNFIKSKNYTTERWWTSLNDINHPGAWTWGTGTTATLAKGNAVVWNVEPDDTHHIENCGAMNIQGALSDEKCAEKHGFICEASNAGATCPDGWIRTTSSTSCYYFSDTTDPFSLLSWNDAASQCQNLYQAGTGNAHLLYLETASEQAYVRQKLPTVKQTTQVWWIGMTDKAKEGVWKWADGSIFSQSNLNWAIEPNNIAGTEQCAVVYNNGRFADEKCDNLANYVCATPVITDVVSERTFGCPNNWVRGGLKCYLFNTTSHQTWADASLSCQKINGKLFEVRDKNDQFWVNFATERYRGYGFWTGLNYHTDDKNWYWSSGGQANMKIIHWNSEPNNYDGSENCGMVLKDGAFNDDSCYRFQGYICELQSEASPCPNGWTPSPDEGSFSCYYISSRADNATATWTEARDLCTTKGSPKDAYLLALNSKEELTFVLHLLQSQPDGPGGWWTGLNDIQTEGMWQYDTAFNNPVPDGLIPWNTEPNNSGGSDYCAIVYYGGRFNDMNCGVKANFICERYPSNSPTSSNQQQGSTGHRVSSRITEYFLLLIITLMLL